MTKLISGTYLRDLIADGNVVTDGSPQAVEDIKYDFHLGSRILKADCGQPCNLEEIPANKRFISSGEAVFVLSKERLNLPSNMIVSLTPKRKISHAGIITLGGLTIDPLYRGYLLIGLYNFSSTPFPLQVGKKLIGALFYELEDGDERARSATPEAIDDFPDDLVRLIGSYQPVEIGSLDARVVELASKITALQNELNDDKAWRNDVRTFIDKFDQQLAKLLTGLEEEKKAREAEDSKLLGRLDGMRENFWGLNLAKRVVIGLALMVAGVVVGYYVNDWLDGPNEPAAAITKN